MKTPSTGGMQDGWATFQSWNLSRPAAVWGCVNGTVLQLKMLLRGILVHIWNRFLTGWHVESIRSKDSRTFLQERQKASSCTKKDTVPPFTLQFRLKSSAETLNFTRKLQAEFVFTRSQKETRKHSTKTKKKVFYPLWKVLLHKP